MIDGRPVTAIVAGRGGSKGLPGKNLADLGGRPMIGWSIAAAQASRFIDHVAASSDDPAILDAARLAGCEDCIERPAVLATDDASIHDAVIHALDVLGRRDGLVVLLQATSPLRTSEDIDACIEACRDAPAALTVTPASKPPQWMYRMTEWRKLSPFSDAGSRSRRQDFEQVYVLNGAVYVAEIEWYRQRCGFLDDDTVGITMPPERSVDIDTAFDLAVARSLIRETEETFQ